MATSFSEIYDGALSKIREYAFIDLDEDEIYATLSPFLKSAETDFAGICVEDISHDEDAEEYSVNLSRESIEILALGVAAYWMAMYVADADKMRNLVSTKDYSFFSPANLLTATHNVRNDVDLNYHAAINRYSYMHGDLIRPEAPHRRGLW